jgi:hypothetical protein
MTDTVDALIVDLLEIQYSGNSSRYIWLPLYAPVRKTERFKALMRKAGLVDYWRARMARSLPPDGR